ncbi:Photoactive yellow protein [Planctomycetes bacterium Poly30]|uniref:Photoactive yellow protein n=1 Tax=Saltatorellus ferox TaxID=2528018 RepID=A0A518EPX4_9BACT|nr:Photoactive yellow protein [Planctomycetes bacterium Poly30]
MSATLNTAMASQASKLAGNSFCDPSLAQSIPTMSPAGIDGLDFGVVKVDDEGSIQLYNKYESELGGRTPASVAGKNFFTEVAVCTNNALFRGIFKEGVEAGTLNHLFPYTFTYKMSPTPVKVHLYRDAASKTNWIFVKKS